MLEPVRRLVIRYAKVPPEPLAPAGSIGSIRVFRAAENYWKYLLVKWGLKQAVAVASLVFFTTMSGVWIDATLASPLVRREPAASPPASPSPPPSPSPSTAEASPPPAESRTKGKRSRRNRRPPITEQQVRRVGWWIQTIELLGALTLLVQLPISFTIARLDYEMRWYIVTDRSLRIREGIIGIREMTLTFANVQNISIRQGPLQRILGLADVVVRTAGGGGEDEEGQAGHSIGKSMHIGRLRAVDNAGEVRDLILERLRRFRDSGLGDPDDAHAHAEDQATTLATAVALRDAARALLAALK